MHTRRDPSLYMPLPECVDIGCPCTRRPPPTPANLEGFANFFFDPRRNNTEF
eukprot:NODE_8083_length_299_cov_13.436000_g7344_i0.p4 GENE.NODE_8083_length_299_cov_13.436000_g7344_i0~~NODE_8083_length_299_cov_13.436000_g7344_i0.p4  ORF type:complete len:52 (-),score=6.70 NODE_8083_length_299_cov_13.436000_g7344_i0:3-158(-)